MYDEFRQRQMQRIDTWLSQNETITLENEELHSRKKLPIEDQGFDGRYVSVIMFNMMFVFYDLLDNHKISASEYREMLVSRLRNSSAIRRSS